MKPSFPAEAGGKHWAGAQRPKVGGVEGVRYGDEFLPFEAFKPPQKTTTKNTPKKEGKPVEKMTGFSGSEKGVTSPLQQPRRATDETSDSHVGVQPPRNATPPPLETASINKKLREQARKLGLKPGSDRWRAYVLGTISAMKKRNLEKNRHVFPGTCNTRKQLSK